MNIPTFIPAKPRVRRQRRAAAAGATPLAGVPILIAAEYLVGEWVRLTFDRPINAGPLTGDELFVDDGAQSETIWVGSTITVLGPDRIEVALLSYDGSGSTDTTLDASGTTGIVSAFDGTEWAGVSDVELPFP